MHPLKLFLLFKYGEKDNPWEKLDYKAVKDIKKILGERVVGQEEAIEKIEKVVVKAYMGLTGIHKSSSRSAPKGVLFFVGPTGVGKTELSKALAKFLFGDEQACIRFDMSEYAQENSDQKLIGAPPGYVGYEEGGQLTNAVKEKPFSIILFDEIEKAAKPNPRILDIFLQILEDGRLTDNKGRIADFKNTIIIMTSNMGSNIIQERMMNVDPMEADRVYDSTKNEVMELLRRTIRPEFLNRIDEVVLFRNLRAEDVEQIVELELSDLRQRAEQLGYRLRATHQAKRRLAKLGYEPQYGARALRRVVTEHIETPLSELILSGEAPAGATIHIECHPTRHLHLRIA